MNKECFGNCKPISTETKDFKTIKMFTDHYIKDGSPVSRSDKENYVEPYNSEKVLYGIKVYSPIEKGYVTILRKGQIKVECKDDIVDGEEAYLQDDCTYTNESLNVFKKIRNVHIGTFVGSVDKNNKVTLNLNEKHDVPPRPIVLTKRIRPDF